MSFWGVAVRQGCGGHFRSGTQWSEDVLSALRTPA